MNINVALCRIGIILSITAAVAVGQTTGNPPPQSVKIGNLTWTKQNVSVNTQGSWCYGNDESNCAKYGRLYTWEAAKAACAGLGGKWRLPTDKEWNDLVDHAGGGGAAGVKLKAKSGWKDGGGGTDDYGFSALPGGGFPSLAGFKDVGVGGYFWGTQVHAPSEFAYIRYMYYNYDGVHGNARGNWNGLSVRCVAGERRAP